MNKQRNDAELINSFRKTYGGPSHVVLCIGDWNQSVRRHHEPVQNVGMCFTLVLLFIYIYTFLFDVFIIIYIYIYLKSFKKKV